MAAIRVCPPARSFASGDLATLLTSGETWTIS